MDAPSELNDFAPGTPSVSADLGGVAARTGVVPLPHVVAWNLTARCNLECAHCYIAAGPSVPTEDDLSAEEFFRITDEILEIVPGPMFVLTGGEPLLRPDLEELAAYAHGRGATVVVGTNGTGLTEQRIASLMAAGVTGVAVSIDSLVPRYHNRFRHGDQALEETTASIERLREAGLDFIVQTTITKANRHELAELVRWSAERGAVSFNLYFLVETGRGKTMESLSPEENDAVLAELVELQAEYRGRMMVRSKCQPALMRHVHEADPDSPLMNYATRCPCGTQYCRIMPDGKLTACPYSPVVAGDLRKEGFAEVWKESPVFLTMRTGGLEGKCGRCAYRQVCGGCRARAYARTGNYLASDESCGYDPVGFEEAILPDAASTYGVEAKIELRWESAAEERMLRIPSFVRGVVVKRVEGKAREEGVELITLEFLDGIRKRMPVDFSKKRPFFLGGEQDKG